MATSSLRVTTRMQILVGLTLVGLVVLCLTALYQLKESMLEDRKQKTKNLVEVGMGILTHHHKLVQEGKLSEEDAKKAARESLRAVRYGSNDYYFIFTTEYVYVLLPVKPEFEGVDKRDLKDTNGKPLIVELVKAAKQGGGFVDYWFPRAGQQKSEPKLSYATLFPAWGWVIGTGIYIDDVDAEYRKSAMILGGISAILLLVLGIAGWRIGASILRQLGGEPDVAAGVMREVAGGNLTASAGTPPKDSLMGALETMIASLRTLVREINGEADLLVRNAEQIKSGSGEVSRRAEKQSEATSAMAAAVQELTVSSSQISDSARQTEGDSNTAMQLAGQGRERVDQAKSAIQAIASTVAGASERIRALEQRANQVSSIANTIKDIADQTNLLALNAAIEAARAGETGRGFAVVADEVRKLAERTTAATAEIEQTISGIQNDTVSVVDAMNDALPQVELGVQLANSAYESLQAIADGANRTVDRVRDVANATQEQGVASTAIAQRVEQVAQMVDETTTTIRASAETANQLERIAQNLKQQIAQFRV